MHQSADSEGLNSAQKQANFCNALQWLEGKQQTRKLVSNFWPQSWTISLQVFVLMASTYTRKDTLNRSRRERLSNLFEFVRPHQNSVNDCAILSSLVAKQKIALRCISGL